MNITTLNYSPGHSHSLYDYDAKARIYQAKTARQAQGEGLAGPDKAAFHAACAKGRYMKLFTLGYPLIMFSSQARFTTYGYKNRGEDYSNKKN